MPVEVSWAGILKVAHGLSGRAHAGEDHALGGKYGRRVGRDLGRNAQRTQRTQNAGLVSRLVVENGKHRDDLG